MASPEWLKRLLIPQGGFDIEDERWQRQLELNEAAEQSAAELVRMWVYHRFGFVPTELHDFMVKRSNENYAKYLDCRERYKALEAAYLAETGPRREVSEHQIVIRLPWPIDEQIGSKEMYEFVTMQVIDQIIKQ